MVITESKLRTLVQATIIKELFDEESSVIKMLKSKEGEKIAPEMMHAVEFLDKIEKEHDVDEKDIEDIKKSGILDLLMKSKK